MPELTTLDEDGIYTVLEINQKQREKILFCWLPAETTAKNLNFDDIDKEEVWVNKSIGSISYKGKDYTLATSELNAEVNEIFDKTYLLPTSDMPEASIYVRYTKQDKTPYIAVKNGMEIQAIFLCYQTVPDFTEEISKLLTLAVSKLKAEAEKYEQTTFGNAGE